MVTPIFLDTMFFGRKSLFSKQGGSRHTMFLSQQTSRSHDVPGALRPKLSHPLLRARRPLLFFPSHFEQFRGLAGVKDCFSSTLSRE